MKTEALAKYAILVLVLFISVIRAYYVPATDGTSRSFLNGDGPSDVNTLSAARYFHDFGLWESKLRPIHGYTTAESAAEAKAYTHSPSFPDMILGAWAILIDSTDEFFLRLLPLLFSIVWFFLVFKLFQTLIPEPNIAFLSSVILVLSSYFVAWTDSLHLHMWSELFRFLFLWWLVSFYQAKDLPRKKAKLAVGMGLLALLMANTGFHLLTFGSVVVVGFSIIYERGFRKIFAPLNLFLGLCFVLGLLIHFYLNSLYFGSIEAAANDFREAFLYRSNQCSDANLCGLGFKEFLQFPLVILRRMERYFLIAGPALIVFFILMRNRLKRENPILLSISWVLLFSGLFWFVVMPQHAWVHHFTGRDFALFVGLTGGYGLVEYGRILKRDFSQPKKFAKIYHSLFVLYLVGMAVTQQILPMFLRDSVAFLFK